MCLRNGESVGCTRYQVSEAQFYYYLSSCDPRLPPYPYDKSFCPGVRYAGVRSPNATTPQTQSLSGGRMVRALGRETYMPPLFETRPS